MTRLASIAASAALALACAAGAARADEAAQYDPYAGGADPGGSVLESPSSWSQENMAAEQHATENIGSWDLPDGSRILSTGKSSLPSRGFDPTMPSAQDNYPIDVFPYVSPGGWGPHPGRGR